MQGDEFIVAVVAIVFGTALSGYILYLIFSTIKAWINRKNSSMDEDSFNRMAQAFIQHKKTTERRLRNLEAIVTGEEETGPQQKQIEQSQKIIEIEAEEPQKEKSKSSDSTLRNILKE